MTRQEAVLDEHRHTNLLEQYRRRFPGLDDAGWERLLQRLRGGEGIRAIGRELVEHGLCGRLRPSSVNVYLSWVKRGLERPGSGTPGLEGVAGDSKHEQPIGAQGLLKRVRWLSRIQQSRVRKALALEGRMGGLLLSQTEKEIKLLSQLLDKEWKLLSAVGGLKATAPGGRGRQGGTPLDPDLLPSPGALRVLTAYRKILQAARQSENSTESTAPPDRPSAPASRGEGPNG